MLTIFKGQITLTDIASMTKAQLINRYEARERQLERRASNKNNNNNKPKNIFNNGLDIDKINEEMAKKYDKNYKGQDNSDAVAEQLAFEELSDELENMLE